MSVYEFGHFRLDAGMRRIGHKGKFIQLSPTTFDILLLLVRKSGSLVKKEELLQEVWPNQFVEENNLTVRISALRKMLGEKPHQPRFIETVPGRGYRFIGKVQDVSAMPLWAAAGAGTGRKRVTERRDAGVTALALLPLANPSNDPNVEYLSDGITEVIINNLSSMTHLRVMAYSTVCFYKGQDVDPMEVGRKLNVQAVLVGRLMQVDNRVIIRVELVDTRSGIQLWGEQYNYPLTNIIVMQEEISREITQQLRLKLTKEDKERLTRRYTQNPEAYHLYLKGRYFCSKRTETGFKTGLKYFKQAIRRDGNFAHAYAGIADSYNLRYSFGTISRQLDIARVRAAAENALRINPNLAEAYASLGYVKMIPGWDWEGAEKDFKRAIALNPDYPTAHHWYAVYLKVRGRFAEALTQLRLALELDPLSLIFNASLGSHFYFARQYERAIEQCRKTLELDPNLLSTYGPLAMALLAQGARYKEALAILRKAPKLMELPEGQALIGYVYAVSGRKRQAQSIIDNLKGLSKRRYALPYNFAIIKIGLGEKDEAVEWLLKAYRERNDALILINVDPRFDALRDDPRFKELLQRMKLAQEGSQTHAVS